MRRSDGRLSRKDRRALVAFGVTPVEPTEPEDILRLWPKSGNSILNWSKQSMKKPLIFRAPKVTGDLLQIQSSQGQVVWAVHVDRNGNLRGIPGP